MTPADLDRLEAEYAAATQGEWHAGEPCYVYGGPQGDTVATTSRWPEVDPNKVNHTLIADMHNALPELIAMARSWAAMEDVPLGKLLAKISTERDTLAARVEDLKAQLVDAHIAHGVTRQSLEQTDARMRELERFRVLCGEWASAAWEVTPSDMRPEMLAKYGKSLSEQAGRAAEYLGRIAKLEAALAEIADGVKPGFNERADIARAALVKP